jgi:hypothetical protein
MDPTYEQIAQLAYQLWEERGRPDGSPDVDWEHAVAALQIESVRLVQTSVERDAAMADARLAEDEQGGSQSNGAAAARKRRSSKTSSQKSIRTQ